MKKYYVSGMSCAACSARVEKAVSGVEGVRYCAVNLLSATMSVEGGDEEKIISAVKAAGYGAALIKGGASSPTYDAEEESKRARRKLIQRLIFSVITLLPLSYISMGYLMWDFPLPKFLSSNPTAIAFTELILSLVCIVINFRFFTSGVKSAIHGSANMDTLVSLGAGVSFIWSVYLTFRMLVEEGHAEHYLHSLYFEAAAMILTLITLGKLLEAYAKEKTTTKIKALVELTPKVATVIRDGREILIPTAEVERGDVFLVRPGESVAVDGIVIEGESAIDESALTGESIPAEKSHGSGVYAATVNTSGFLKCEATRVGEDTAMARVVQLVSDAAASKAPISKLADRVAAFFVPTVLIIAAITAIIWFFVNNSLSFALRRAVSVLVISCPCAMGLATPVAIMVASGIGASGGVLFKSASALEALGKMKNVALDKTGTVTTGVAEVVEVIPLSFALNELLQVAAALEEGSEHPLGKAIMRYIEEKKINIPNYSSFSSIAGGGVSAVIDGESAYGGSLRFIKERIEISAAAEEHYERISDLGRTPVFFAKGGELIGIIAVRDAVREDSKAAVSDLRRLGINTVIITGDNARTARAVADEVGVSEVISEVMPDGKEKEIRRLSSLGGVAMVGDGINDAPAIVAADVGIAIGRGTEIAIDSADVVLVRSSLSDVVSAIKLSRATLKIIRENLFFAFVYNVIGIPLAAGVFVSAFGLDLDPMFGALAMSLSSFSVVMNALRLNLKKIFTKCDKTNNYTVKEGAKMVKTLKVEGMMCPHCEARVKEILLGIDGVVSADVSHKEGRAVVTSESEIDTEVLISAVTGAGYKAALSE